MRLGRLAILTLITTALLGGQLPAAAPAAGRQDGLSAQTVERTVAAGQDLLAPDDDSPQEQAPAPQVPEPKLAHGEEIESKDFASDFLLVCTARAAVGGALAEVHTHSELVQTSELTLHGLHRLQI
jgi:hypothetical protein